MTWPAQGRAVRPTWKRRVTVLRGTASSCRSLGYRVVFGRAPMVHRGILDHMLLVYWAFRERTLRSWPFRPWTCVSTGGDERRDVTTAPSIIWHCVGVETPVFQCCLLRYNHDIVPGYLNDGKEVSQRKQVTTGVQEGNGCR